MEEDAPGVVGGCDCLLVQLPVSSVAEGGCRSWFTAAASGRLVMQKWLHHRGVMHCSFPARL